MLFGAGAGVAGEGAPELSRVTPVAAAAVRKASVVPDTGRPR